MRIRHLSFGVIFIFVFAISCNNADKDSIREEARTSLRDIPPGSVAPPAATGSSLSSTGGGVLHYICPNNCEGSGGAAAGTCPVCGSEYQHNQAYHSQPTTNTQPTASNTDPVVDFGNLDSPSPTAEPAQNAAGIWHYTCPSGCTGGAGKAGKCATCGGDLAHNTAYHSGGAASSGPTIDFGSGTPSISSTPPAISAEPAQNAAGVWHYTCPSGCTGGGGSAGKCSSCGADLAHNTAYHN